MIEQIELVIFDCDGVLVDTELLANRVFIEEIKKFGFELTEAEAWEHFPGTRLLHCIEYVERSNGRRVPTEFIDIYRTKSAAAFATEMEAIPGVLPILERLTLPRVVASNGPLAGIRANLLSAGLADYFDRNHLFSAYEIGKWKPEPDLHLWVSATMNVKPAHCLVIEDSVAGIEAAQAAGMQVIGFTHEGRNHRLLPLELPKIDRMEDLESHIPYALHTTPKSLFSL
jgi:HAD superfamily hydrolase (TIGR01509 family)